MTHAPLKEIIVTVPAMPPGRLPRDETLLAPQFTLSGGHARDSRRGRSHADGEKALGAETAVTLRTVGLMVCLTIAALLVGLLVGAIQVAFLVGRAGRAPLRRYRQWRSSRFRTVSPPQP
ncbi:hypothetical protein RN607_09900 [Demequina capsici]|uniref:Uncharacterized protein n=1 Tax=Demequina capsici TaxID=3075620 RepID=A0AA96F965_9MICO|nr:hypothetical protein [Demequina sp. PMTSA13]WNM26511.1 hypothetical protein RN607_09900 [Demequina sp. PMTSA13]